MDETWEKWNAGIEEVIAAVESQGHAYVCVQLDVEEIGRHGEAGLAERRGPDYHPKAQTTASARIDADKDGWSIENVDCRRASHALLARD